MNPFPQAHPGLWRTLPAALLASSLMGCAVPSPLSATQGVLPTGPAAGDQVLSPFYAWNQPLPTRPGVMLRTEPAPAQAEIQAAGSALRMLYSSSDARWRSGLLPVSGTLYLPRGEPPAGGWPVLAWAHGTLGVADVCAPSWAGHRPRDAHYLNRWLEQGFAVVATDYQGLGGPGPHPYLHWEAEGRSVLDAVRAALGAHGGRLANRVVISGQSQGSGSALGASRIAATYAPELNLVATIATGLVSSFPQGPVRLEPVVSGRGAPSRFTMLRLVGGGLPDTGPDAESLVSERGAGLLQKARETCVDELRGHEQQQGLDLAQALRIEPAQLNALLLPATDMDAARLPAPLFLGTGLADRTIVPRRQFAAVAALCAAGNRLVWTAYPGITHNGIVNAAFDDSLALVRRVLAGGSVPDGCGSLREPGPPGPATPGLSYND